jgi:hypothetical protein
MHTSADEQLLRALGSGVVRRWAELTPEVQHILFEAAAAAHGQSELREELALFLHEHHPRTR